MSQPEQRKYALADYSVELRGRGWYFGRQYDRPRDYRGPYASIASVTLVIARQLRREIERRHKPAPANGAVASEQDRPLHSSE